MISAAEQKPALDKFDLLEEIGHGGMATVYRARDRRLEREVAVKVIHRHLRENEEVAARFAREARAVAKLRHPGIVEVYDVSSEEEDERYLVVELIRGTTLRKMLGQLDYLPAEVAAGLGLRLAAALGHAHEEGVVHRDIKPENVLVELPRNRRSDPDSKSPKSEPKSGDEAGLRIMLTDFGIAKLLDAQGVTSTGQVLGSPAHMAPEQIEGGDVSARADVFALGVLLYECMVGHLPFEGKNPAQVLRRVLDGVYPPADRERSTIGTGWSRLLDRALANDPENRFESADELADALKQEAASIGFDDPDKELVEFFADPDAYREAYEDRVVERLTEAGEEARKTRNIPLATGLYNRALAFRPGDRELLARVSRVAQGQRRRRTVRRIGMIAGLSAVLGGAAFALSQAAQESTPAALPDDGARGTSGEPKAAANDPKAEPVISAEPVVKTEAPPVRKKSGVNSKKMGTPKYVPPKVEEHPPRSVSVMANYSNAIVKIDGKVVRWPGTVQLEVDVPHGFEFLPPKGDPCCVPDRKTVTIPPGEGAYSVTGSLKFNDASLVVRGTGGKASCNFLPGQALTPGMTLPVRMTDAVFRGDCTVFPLNSTPAPKSVRLLAGKPVELSW